MSRSGHALTGRGIDTAGLVVLPGRTSTSRIRVDDVGCPALRVRGLRRLRRLRSGPVGRWSGPPECGAVHIGLLPGAGPVREYLAGRGVLVSQDCGVTRPPENFQYLGIAFCSQEAAGQPPEQHCRRAPSRAGRGLAVVTRGAGRQPRVRRPDLVAGRRPSRSMSWTPPAPGTAIRPASCTPGSPAPTWTRRCMLHRQQRRARARISGRGRRTRRRWPKLPEPPARRLASAAERACVAAGWNTGRHRPPSAVQNAYGGERDSSVWTWPQPVLSS